MNDEKAEPRFWFLHWLKHELSSSFAFHMVLLVVAAFIGKVVYDTVSRPSSTNTVAEASAPDAAPEGEEISTALTGATCRDMEERVKNMLEAEGIRVLEFSAWSVYADNPMFDEKGEPRFAPCTGTAYTTGGKRMMSYGFTKTPKGLLLLEADPASAF